MIEIIGVDFTIGEVLSIGFSFLFFVLAFIFAIISNNRNNESHKVTQEILQELKKQTETIESFEQRMIERLSKQVEKSHNDFKELAKETITFLRYTGHEDIANKVTEEDVSQIIDSSTAIASGTVDPDLITGTEYGKTGFVFTTDDDDEEDDGKVNNGNIDG